MIRKAKGLSQREDRRRGTKECEKEGNASEEGGRESREEVV